MAENTGPSGGEDKFGFLVRKIGPMPVWAWGAIIVGVYYWYTHYGPGKTSANAANTSQDQNSVTETLNQTTGPGDGTGMVPVPPLTPTPPVTGNKPPEQTVGYSWTDTGQKWTANQLAKNLGITVGALRPSNRLGQKALNNPNAAIAKGAKFTYTSGKVVPAGGTARTSPNPSPSAHARHNHDARRYGTTMTQENVTIPDSLIEAQQAQSPSNQSEAGTIDVIPHRPLGM